MSLWSTENAWADVQRSCNHCRQPEPGGLCPWGGGLAGYVMCISIKLFLLFLKKCCL